jgi:hypothetical protein
MDDFDFDVFISHASEDKSAFVTPLANALKRYGLRVWFDKFTLKVGDSLHRSIEKGLARSRYGVVVFSPKFLAKNWPMTELDGLFEREMEGHKVILPVWHRLSSARIKKVLPMLAGKFALRSSDGIEAVARSLVETVRPELLELDVKQASAFEATEIYIHEAKLRNPGYDFTVRSGPATDVPSPGTKFAIANSSHRIEIRVSNPAAITNPPGGRIRFFGEGVKKAIESERTGKAQKWGPGEVALTDWNLPLMPPNLEGCTIAVGERRVPNVTPRSMRVEVGSPPTVVFPIMEAQPARLGTHESEFVLTDTESPLKFSVVLPIGSEAAPIDSQKADLTLSWEEITGKKISECKRLIEAVDALRSGEELRFIDIRLSRPIFNSKVSLPCKVDPFEPNLRRIVFLASQIEEAFAMSLRMPEVISEADTESLLHLDCLLNGREYGRAENNILQFVKADGEAGAEQERFVRGEWPAILTVAPSNYPGYFPLFGQRVATRDWVQIVEFTPADGSAAARAFSEAAIGSELTIEITAEDPASLRWRDDSMLSGIEVGNMAGSQL